MDSTSIADSKTLDSTTSPPDTATNLPETMDPNHDIPARTDRDTDKHEQAQPTKEDPATIAASEELRTTTIHDKSTGNTEEDVAEEKITKDDSNTTPEPEARDEEMRERISSPKKKRGRDQDEDEKDVDEEDGTSSADGSVVNGSRASRLEPEKKRRPRDTSQDPSTDKEREVKVRSFFITYVYV